MSAGAAMGYGETTDHGAIWYPTRMQMPSEEMQCLGCYGSGVQRNKKTGLNVLCPICLGTGKIRRPRDITHRRALWI
jgi:DnaJ-class molecular chaperone